MSFERLLNEAPLDALASPVDETHLTEPGLEGGRDVFGDDRLHVSRSEGVEIERALDGNLVGHGRFDAQDDS